MGIGPEHRKQLFQPFNRLAAENGRTPGSGLGLVIVRSLMREMKGGISIASTEGVGTTVRLTFEPHRTALAPVLRT